MKTNHTPGPWSLEYDYSLVMPYKRGNHIVTGGPIGPDGADREERRANMKLIATSPTMIESILKFRRHAESILEQISTDKYLTTEEANQLLRNYLGAVIETSTDLIDQAIKR